jgi:hypothetical protein
MARHGREVMINLGLTASFTSRDNRDKSRTSRYPEPLELFFLKREGDLSRGFKQHGIYMCRYLCVFIEFYFILFYFILIQRLAVKKEVR